jgi:hypothetical protein
VGIVHRACPHGLLSYPEDRGDLLPSNIITFWPHQTTSHPRIQSTTKLSTSSGDDAKMNYVRNYLVYNH